MGILQDWGFSAESWKGVRGEYWVLVQAGLLIGFGVLPVYRPAGIGVPAAPGVYGVWLLAAVLAGAAAILLLKGLLDLGGNLTPLPHPKDEGELVQSGVYRVVRHPLYSGLTLAALSWAVYQVSLSHTVAALILLLFFNAKADREETWLVEKYPDYQDYRKQVKKLIPWVY